MALFSLCVVLLALGYCRAGDVPENVDDLKSVLEDLLQKLDSLQQTLVAREEQMFDKLDKRIDGLEAELMMKVEEVIKETLQNRSETERDLFEKITNIENVINSSCGVKSADNEKNIADLKEKMDYLLNKSDCVQSCEPCDVADLCSNMKDETSTSTTSYTTPTEIMTSSTTASETMTLSTTTPPPPEDKTFLLVPLWSSYFHHLRDINFKGDDEFYKVSYKQIDAATCAPNLDQVFIATYSPDQIIQVNGKGRDTKLIRAGIKSWGMTVDNSRNLIFLTSGYPNKAVFSMTAEGDDLTEILGPSHFERSPRAIAVNPKTQVIYGSDDGRIFSVNYDGTNYTSNLIISGIIYGLAVNIEENVLYFSVNKRIYAMNLETFSADGVTEVESTVYNLEYYDGKLYFTAFGDPIIGVIDLNAEWPTVVYTRRFELSEVTTFVICPK